MRVYIIGNDGITLCLKASATLNDGPGCRCMECIRQFLLEVGILRRPPSMGQARIQFPPLLAGVIGRNAHDYEGQEQKQRNGLPRPMFCTGLGIIPIFALIWLGHFKSLSFERRARRLRRIKYPIDGVSVKLRHQRGALYDLEKKAVDRSFLP